MYFKSYWWVLIASKLFRGSYGAITWNCHGKQGWPEDHFVVSLQGATAGDISYVLGQHSRDSRLHFWCYCFRMPGHYEDMTVHNGALPLFCCYIFLKGFWVTVPGESELSSLTCNLTAPFVILHNCCHPGKTKWFFSLVNSPTLSLKPFGQDRQWGT